MNRLFDDLCSMFIRKDGAGLTDGQLLASFIATLDESAFVALVRRHGRMVLGVCKRLLSNIQDAEDAYQATFLVLARKAASIRPREAVGNWLYGVAYRTALEARTVNARRRSREQQVKQMPNPAVRPEEPQSDLRPLLDHELSRLPDKYRLPIVLCELEGRTRREVALQLGVPEGTLSSRLATGRKLLAKRLANRGVVLTAGSLAILVSQAAASGGVQSSLVISTVKAATVIAAGQATVAGMVSANVAALMTGVLKAMLLSKIKTPAVGLLLFAMLSGAAGKFYQTQAAEQMEKVQANKTVATSQKVGHQSAEGGSVKAYEVYPYQQSPQRKTEIIQIQHIQSSDLAEILAKRFKDAEFIGEVKTNKLAFSINPKDYDQLKKMIVELDELPPQIKVDFVLKGISKAGEEVLAAPSVITADGQAARVLVGQSFPIVNQNKATITYTDIGLLFTILPNKLADGRWQMDCTMEISEPSKAEHAADVQVLRRVGRCVTAVRSGDTVQMEINMDDAGEVRRLVMFTVHEKK